MKINKMVYMIIIFLIIVVFVYFSLDQKNKNISNVDSFSTIKNQEVSIGTHKTGIKNANKTRVYIPVGYQPLKVLTEHTTQIGTSDHPTIEGGIINTTDNNLMTQSEPDEKLMEITKNNKIHTYNQNKFQDNWVMNKEVESLLISAANNGKLHYVLKKTTQMGLPASIALIPMVESNYRTDVISPKGAVGAWQLMPAVAKDYGILNKDRFDFFSSTDVALRLLNDLHQQFNNWDLAFAAYNAGSKRIINALHENPEAKNVDELNIPQETKLYVNKIKAINHSLRDLNERDA